MKSRTVILAFVVLAASALVVAGCGGDDEEPATETEEVALSEEEFLAQGNEICAAGNDALEQIANDTFAGQQPTEAEIEQFAGLLVENVQGQIDAIRVLPPPEELATDVEAFLGDAEDVLAEVEDDPSLLAASESDDPFADINAQALELGLTECAG